MEQKFGQVRQVGDNLLRVKLSSLTPHSKRNSEYFDPCQEAADKSVRCLRRNGGDKAMCQDYFEYV